MTRAPIRVLIVDDSASVRQVLSSILSDDPGIMVMGAAADALPRRAGSRPNCPTS